MIEIDTFGAFEGKDVYRASLVSSTGVTLNILNYGALIQDWKIPIKGSLLSVVLGFNSFDPYPEQSPYFGAIVGRVAGRVGGGCFELNGRNYNLDLNDGIHHLHGGHQGLSNQIWNMDVDRDKNQLRLSYVSEDGAMGYPGRVEFCVAYRLSGNRLRIEFLAMPDRTTPISLAQHNYFNLGTSDHVLDHSLFIAADNYTPCDDHLIPTGEIIPVRNTIFDFRNTKNLRDSNESGVGYDQNFILHSNRNDDQLVAQAYCPDDLVCLKLFTDRPGLQLFNGANLNTKSIGHKGARYGSFAGFCLEDQMLPNALQQSHFPSIMCDPNNPYSHWCEIDIS